MHSGVENKTAAIKLSFAAFICCICLSAISCQSKKENVTAALEKCQSFLKSDKILAANRCWIKTFIDYPENTKLISDTREKKLFAKCVELQDEKRKFGKAIICLKGMSLHKPNDAKVQLYLANSYLDFYKSKEIKNKTLLKEATVAIKKSIKLAPDKAISHETYGRILTQLGNSKEALTELEKATYLAPDKFLYWMTLALFHKGNGDSYSAIKNYKRVLGLNPRYTLALYDLGVLYEKVGKIKEAIKSYEKLLSIRKSYEDAQERLDRLKKIHAVNKQK